MALHLIPIYLDLRSVSAVCDLLNSRLPDESGRLYPNRLHSLFSVDPAQTVNEATVHSVNLAVRGCPVDREKVAMSLRQLKPQVLAAWERTNRRRGAIAIVADSVGIPPAVAQFALEHEGVFRRDADGTDSGGRGGGGVKLPDWSFQDDAVRACLHDLTASPNAKSPTEHWLIEASFSFPNSKIFRSRILTGHQKTSRILPMP